MRRGGASEQLRHERGTQLQRVRRPVRLVGVAEHLGERARVAGVARERDRLIGEPPPRLDVRGVRQLLRLEREQPGAPCRLCGLVEFDRALNRVDSVLIDLAGDAHKAAVVRERGPCGKVRIVDGGRDPAGFEQCLAVGGVAGQALRLAESGQHLTPRLGGRGPGQLERLGEQAGRFGRRETLERPPPRA